MGHQPLGHFIHINRDEIARRCREKVIERLKPKHLDIASDVGIPAFLDDLVHELGQGASRVGELKLRASRRGADLFQRGFTIGQVVQDYGSVCQSVTELAGDVNASISVEDFRTLNQCLDDAIAMAVSEYARHQMQNGAAAATLSHAMTVSNLAQTALHGFEALQSGAVGITGTTANVVHRSLLTLRNLTTVDAGMESSRPK